MAKFKQGNLVLSTSEKIIQGSNTLFENSNMTADSMKVVGTTKADGTFYAGDTAPDSTTRVNYDGYFYATKTFNNVWNDYADFQKVIGTKIPGMCYYDTIEGAKRCTEYCQKSVIGIISDTYGHAVGFKSMEYAPFAIAGWVLAYIESDVLDKIEPGDVLTSSPTGRLTLMLGEDIVKYPERIVAIYKKPEHATLWGPDGAPKIEVKGRHWVKVK